MPYRDTSDPAVVMGKTLLSPSTSKDSTDDIVDILPSRFDELTLPMLGAAFFEQGWLAPRVLNIRPSDTVALGDVGYLTKDGEFVAVDNVHHSLQAESGPLSWKGHQIFHSGCKKLEDTSADIIVSQPGKSYRRRRQVCSPVSSDLINHITYFSLCALTIPAQMHIFIDLEYENLDQMHTWKLLQHEAHSIIAQHSLSSSPHEMILGEWRYTSRNSF